MRNFEELLRIIRANKKHSDESYRKFDKEIKQISSNDDIKNEIDSINGVIAQNNSLIAEANSLISEAENAISEAQDAGIEIQSSLSVSSLSDLDKLDTSISKNDTTDMNDCYTDTSNIVDGMIEQVTEAFDDVWEKVVNNIVDSYEDNIKIAKKMAQSFNLDEDIVVEKQKELFLQNFIEKDLDLDFTAYAPYDFCRSIEAFVILDIPIEIKEVVMTQFMESFLSYGLNHYLDFHDSKNRFKAFTQWMDDYQTEDGQAEKLTQSILENIQCNPSLQSYYINKFGDEDCSRFRILTDVHKHIMDNIERKPEFADTLFIRCLSTYNTEPSIDSSAGGSFTQYQSNAIKNTFEFFTNNEIKINLENVNVQKAISESIQNRSRYVEEKDWSSSSIKKDELKKLETRFIIYQNNLNLKEVMSKASCNSPKEEDATNNQFKL